MKAAAYLLLLSFPFSACDQQDSKLQGEWIKGSGEEQLHTIEKHFRGFDMAMVETGYRYQELYWAGQDENWDYADYQAGKIKVAIENGLERRPKRAASSEAFLNITIPQMQEAIKSGDTIVFNRSFRTLTIQCNACHVKEQVPFFQVKPPVSRQSPIQK